VPFMPISQVMTPQVTGRGVNGYRCTSNQKKPLIDVCFDNDSEIRGSSLYFRPPVGCPRFIRYAKVNSNPQTFFRHFTYTGLHIAST
jgi:hypothetical protein